MCEWRWEFPAHLFPVKCAKNKKKRNSFVIYRKFLTVRLLLPSAAFFFVTTIWNTARTWDFNRLLTCSRNRLITKLNFWRLAVSGGRLWVFWPATSSLDQPLRAPHYITMAGKPARATQPYVSTTLCMHSDQLTQSTRRQWYANVK